MISLENRNLIQELSKMPNGMALRAFLDEQYAVIADIKTCQSWEEVQGRKFALQLLKDLFSVLEEKKSTDRKSNQYV